MFKRLIFLTSFVVVLGLAGSASAQLIAYEPFDYPANGLSGNDGGSGWNGAWDGGDQQVTAPGLAFSPLLVKGNKATVAGNESQSFRNLPEPMGDNETQLWISFVGQADQQPGANMWGGVSFHEPDESLFLGVPWQEGDGDKVWGLDTKVDESLFTEIPITEKIIFVARIDFNTEGDNDTVTAWAKSINDTDPLDLTDETAFAQYTTRNIEFSRVRVAGNQPVNIDEIRLGMTPEDVLVEPPVTITVEAGGDIAAANETAEPGDTIEIAEGTYYLTSQIEIKDGVTYKGAGAGLTIIDGNNVTRAFVAWGDRGATNGQVDVNGNSVPNATGPTGWVLDSLTIQNCVSDNEDRQDILSSARDLLNNYTGTPYTLVTAQEENTGITDDPGWFDILSGSADDDLTDVELQAYLDGNPAGSAGHLVVNDDKNRDGGAVFCGNGAVGTIANCDFLNNSTPVDGDDGGAINISGLSVVTINDCLFNGNYACSPDSVSLDGADGDGGHIRAQGSTPVGGFITPGTTLIVNRCVFLNGNAEDDGGAIQAAGQGIVVRLDSCWFEGNTSWDNGTVLSFPNEDQNEATVTNCVFANNVTKSDNSPDRMIETRRNSKFINCTFVGNIQEDQDLIYNNANAADGDNDGVDDEMADTTQVINCIFANNVVGNGDDVLGSRNDDFTIAATNCIFFGNTLQNGNAADNTQRTDVETGSVLTDPLLDAEYVPIAGSPAIDAGTAAGAPDHDFDGAPRPQGAAHDIGAYEAPAN